MKRKLVFSAILLFMLSMLLQAPVFAADVMYAGTDIVYVYEEQNTNSAVLGSYNGGASILIEGYTDDGWAGVLATDPSGDGQTLGWIPVAQLSYSMPSQYCAHQWDEWTVVTEPTCTTSGMQTHGCSICGVGEAVDIPPLGHQFGDWTVRTQATCQVDGTAVRTCVRCGQEESQTIPKTDHTFGTWAVTKQATCIAEGEQVRKCTVCGYEEKQTIAKVDHKYGDWTITKQASCTAEGERVRTCTVCRTQQKEVIAKVPHNFGAWSVTKQATCAAEGEQVRTCSVCKTQEKQAVAKLPHDYKWVVTVEATDHSAGVRKQVSQKCNFEEAEETFDPEGTIRQGDSGDAVKELQQLLIDHKYLNEGAADGIFGSSTLSAIMSFQKDNGFAEDGVAWPQTIEKLQHHFRKWKTLKKLTRTEAGERVRVCKDCGFEQHQIVELVPSVKSGDLSTTVQIIQQMLTDLGCDAGAYDGIYGQKLDEAFAKFAREKNLEFTAGTVLPAQVDELLNGWIAAVPAQEWGSNDATDAAVDLVLTVKPAKKKENKKDEIVDYKWTLTNNGSEPCTYFALLLNYESDPDFKSDNVVLDLEGVTLDANGGSTSGTVQVSKNWSENKPSFCALAAVGSADNYYTSSIVTIE